MLVILMIVMINHDVDHDHAFNNDQHFQLRHDPHVNKAG